MAVPDPAPRRHPPKPQLARPLATANASPLVSVIIPTHNRADVLPRAIESALAQTYQNVEIMVVDDRSTDDTAAVLNRYHTVHVLRNRRTRGASGARNTGIKEATGELIAFLDSDDAWLPDKLTAQVRRLKASPLTVGAIYCGVEGIYPGNKTSRTMAGLSGDIYRDLLIQNRVGSASRLLVPRSVFGDVGLFNEEFKTLNDWEMVLRIAKKYRIECVKECGVRYFFERGDHLSLRSREVFLAHRRIQKTFSPDDRRAARRGAHLSALALSLSRLGRKRLARRYILRSLILRPSDREALRLAYRLITRPPHSRA